jgi:hypothetical protein
MDASNVSRECEPRFRSDGRFIFALCGSDGYRGIDGETLARLHRFQLHT